MSPKSHSLTALTLSILSTLCAGAIVKITALAEYDDAPDPFMFVPNNPTAEVGDILEFHFAGPGKGVLGGNHSVAQGVWGKPCVPTENGFFSGYMPVNATSTEADMVFQVPVTSSDPMVFYCTQGTHCTRGMYGVLNGADDQTLKSYRDSITVNKPGVAPNNVGGGTLLANNVSNILAAPEPENSARGMQISSIGGVVAAVGLGVVVLMGQ